MIAERRLAQLAFVCPQCGKVNECATFARDGNHSPREGDLGVCFGCAAALIYQADAPPRMATGDEIRGLQKADADLLARTICAVIAVRGAAEGGSGRP